MRPGEIATCRVCGAQARATWSGQERPHQDGWPVLVTWTHGPHERCHVVTTVEPPTRCSWCKERQEALGPDAPPLYRPAAGAELAPEAALPPPPPATRGQLSLL